MATSTPQQLTPQQAAQLNQNQRSLVLGSAVRMKQRVLSTTFDPTQNNVVNFVPRNVGLILGFIVEVVGTLHSTGAAAALTPHGASNVVSNFTFTDLNNQQRINTSGRHLALLNTARQGFGFGGTYSPALPIGYGNNFNAFAAPSAPAADADAPVRFSYYVPLAYNAASDLRGAIYGGVVSANMNLAIAINQNPFVGAVPANDPVNAVYQGNANGAWKAGQSVTVNVYQIYLDQLPMSNGVPVLPFMDLNTIYDIKETTVQGMTVGSDFAIAYPNFRDFLSTIVVYDNGGALNGGADVNYFSLTSANFTNLWLMTPTIAALDARQVFMADPPLGTYYFDSRVRPISTLQFGNMELNINAAQVNAGAKAIIGWESFGQISQLTGVGGPSSLPTG